jgi:hypothetical protein
VRTEEFRGRKSEEVVQQISVAGGITQKKGMLPQQNTRDFRVLVQVIFFLQVDFEDTTGRA